MYMCVSTCRSVGIGILLGMFTKGVELGSRGEAEVSPRGFLPMVSDKGVSLPTFCTMTGDGNGKSFRM